MMIALSIVFIFPPLHLGYCASRLNQREEKRREEKRFKRREEKRREEKGREEEWREGKRREEEWREEKRREEKRRQFLFSYWTVNISCIKGRTFMAYSSCHVFKTVIRTFQSCSNKIRYLVVAPVINLSLSVLVTVCKLTCNPH